MTDIIKNNAVLYSATSIWDAFLLYLMADYGSGDTFSWTVDTVIINNEILEVKINGGNG